MYNLHKIQYFGLTLHNILDYQKMLQIQVYCSIYIVLIRTEIL